MSARRIDLVATLSVVGVVFFTSSCGDSTAPPKPTKLVFVTEPSAIAETMIPLETQPVLQTVDASGNAVGTSTTVTVKVINGNGAVVNSGSATTTATGLATFAGLTLGALNASVGPVTLEFSANGLTPITAGVELRCALLTLVPGQLFTGALTTGDCARNGIFNHVFRLATSQPLSAMRFTYDGAFREGLFVRGVNEPATFWGFVSPSGSTTPIHFAFKVLLPAGSHRVTLAAMDPGTTGSYTLAAATESEDLTCEPVGTFAASPITTTQQLATGDCQNTSTGSFEDGLIVGLPSGAVVAASMGSAAFDPRITLFNAVTGAAVASASNPGTANITFTNPLDQPGTAHVLILTSASAGATGAYSLTLNITYPAAIRAAQSMVNSSPMGMKLPIATDAGSSSLVGAFSPASLQR